MKEYSKEIQSKYINTGKGPTIQVIDINHQDYIALIDPDTAFWSLIPKDDVCSTLISKDFLNSYRNKINNFSKEINELRFGLKPSAVYFNPTERCNFDCKYCYIPKDMRKNGLDMSFEKMDDSIVKIKDYFNKTLSKEYIPQIIFHGSEPMLNKEAVFEIIKKHHNSFNFGIQTNATLLDNKTIEFFKSYQVSIGISIDGHTAEIANKTRVNWYGIGEFDKIVKVLKSLSGYKKFSVITTLTSKNIEYSVDIIKFLHDNGVEICLLNVLRCTQPYSRELKPKEYIAAKYFTEALKYSHKLYKETGRKIVIANFANILLSIVAPTARKLMCDISPCGGGRCFFAVSANGDVFPCSEFIGLNDFNCGNILKQNIEVILKSDNMNKVTSRTVENINPCYKCAIRHFCGAPCPAEAYTMNGRRDKIGAFCEFYEEQVRFAFRLIADNEYDEYLYDNWDEELEKIYMFQK